MKKFSIPALFMALGLAMFLMSGNALAQTQTAQSVMASADFDSGAYQIVGTITWTYNRGNHIDTDLTGTAMSYYTNTTTSGPTFVSCGGNPTNCGTGNAPPSTTIAAAEPTPRALELQQHAQAERCTFFFGYTLTGASYEQTATVKGANGNGNWTYKWTYTIAPDATKDSDVITPDVQVAAYTAWSSEETGGTVDVGFSGFLTSESFQKQSTRNKYSFTMLEGGVTRARNVSATLQKSAGLDWTNVASVDLNNVDTDANLVNDGVTIVPATVDFTYFGNAGRFGNSAVFGALHAAGGKLQNGVVGILTGVNDGTTYIDNFAGNNNDLTAGNVHKAPFESEFAGLTEDGNYRIVISGVLKGNNGTADFGFSVTEDQTVIGGCTP